MSTVMVGESPVRAQGDSAPSNVGEKINTGPK